MAISGNILPEASRDKSLENSSPIATAWSDRNFLGASTTGVIHKTSDENGPAFETSSVNLSPYFSRAFKSWTIEGSMSFLKADHKLFFTNSEDKIDENEFTQNLKIARRLNKTMAIGFEHQRFAEDLDDDGVRSQSHVERFGPSYSQKLSPDVIWGLEYHFVKSRLIDEANTSSFPDLRYSQFLTGVGYISPNFSENSGWMLEGSYFVRGRKEKTKANGNFQRIGLSRTYRFEWLYRKNRIEIESSFNFNYSDNFDQTAERDSKNIQFSIEYLFNDRIYFGPLISIGSSVTDNSGIQTKTRENTYSTLIGYRSSAFTCTIILGIIDFRSESEGSVSKSDGDRYLASLNFARLF